MSHCNNFSNFKTIHPCCVLDNNRIKPDETQLFTLLSFEQRVSGRNMLLK